MKDEIILWLMQSHIQLYLNKPMQLYMYITFIHLGDAFIQSDLQIHA